MNLFMVGVWCDGDSDIIKGIFSDFNIAVNLCTTNNHFIIAFTLDMDYSKYDEECDGGFYPKCEPIPESFKEKWLS